MEGACPGAENCLSKCRCGMGASMKRQIINVDLRTDLEVTAIALIAVVSLAVIGFTFNLVIAPF
jgi:hypothetical protein